MSTAAALPRVEWQHQNHARGTSCPCGRARHPRDDLPTGRRRTRLRQPGHRPPHREPSSLSRETSEAVKGLRELEVARLDALQASLWDQAMAGDVDAAQAAMRIIIARCRLLGLYDQKPTGLNAPWRPTTVVLTAEDRAALGL